MRRCSARPMPSHPGLAGYPSGIPRAAAAESSAGSRRFSAPSRVAGEHDRPTNTGR